MRACVRACVRFRVHVHVLMCVFCVYVSYCVCMLVHVCGNSLHRNVGKITMVEEHFRNRIILLYRLGKVCMSTDLMQITERYQARWLRSTR